MRYALLLLLCLVVMPSFAQNGRLPKPGPTALEKFVGHRHTQIVRVEEIFRFGGNEAWIGVHALFARNHQTSPSEMRGIWFAVGKADVVDNVYLPMPRVVALQQRLSDLQDLLKHSKFRMRPEGVLGTEDCAPSLAERRIHKLCVGVYRTGEKMGLSISTGPTVSLAIPDVELAEFVSSIDSAQAVLERR